VELTGTYEVRYPFHLSELSVRFEYVPRNAGPQKRTVIITRGDAGPLRPRVVSVEGPGAGAVLREVIPGDRYEVDITTSPPWPRHGHLSNKVTLETGVEQEPETTVRVWTEFCPRVRARPSRFLLPPEVTHEIELSAILQWSPEAPPGKIIGVSTNVPGLTATLDETADRQAVILGVPAGLVLPEGERPHVLVETDDPEQTSLRIPIYTVRPPRVRD
jgi:hypothetical protein